MIDPRFKDKFFSSTGEHINAKELLESKVEETLSTTEPTTTTTADHEPPAEKHATTDIMKCLDKILEETGTSMEHSFSSSVDMYLTEPILLYCSGNPYVWWAENNL